MIALGALLALCAAPERVVIVPAVISGQTPGVAAGEIHAAVKRAAARRVGLEVMGEEELFVVAPDAGRALRECGAEVGCQLRALADTRAVLGIAVLLNELTEPPFLAVRLYDVQGRRLIGEALGVIAAGEATVLEATARRADRLLDASGRGASGAVLVADAPPEVQLSLSSTRAGSPPIGPDADNPGRFTARPGRYALEARGGGKAWGAQTVVVRAGEVARVGLAPVIIEHDDPTYLWLIIGGAVVGAAVAALVLLPSSEPRLCVAPPGKDCGD